MTTSPDRLESALQAAVRRLTGDGCPPRLAAAITDAVFPAGNRLRPRLAYAVAAAIGERDPRVTDAAAVALELLHCASLVQDDLPAFDDAIERRGRPALHIRHDEPLAVLAADALIIGAFETVAAAGPVDAPRARALTSVIARGSGAPHGAVAGQAWESEDRIDLARYHRAKTAALFEAATVAGAVAAGGDEQAWRDVGTWLGRAYQVADDIADAHDPHSERSDAALGRPNARHQLGDGSALRLFNRCATEAIHAVPDCSGADRLRAFVGEMLRQFHPLVAVEQQGAHTRTPAPVTANR